MGKRAAKAPLAVISPNEPFSGTRTRSRGTPISGKDQGQENDNLIRSSLRGFHSEASTPKEQHEETSRSAKEHKGRYSSQKRARLAVTEPSRSALRGGDKDSQREDSIAGSQTVALIQASNDSSSNAVNGIENIQTGPNAETSSLLCDAKQNGSVLGNSVENYSFSEGPGEHQSVVPSLGRNRVTVQVSVSATPLVPLDNASLEKFERRHSLSHAPSQSGNKVSTEASGGKEPIEGTSQIAPISNGKPHSRDQHRGMESIHVGETADLQATVSRATDTLQNAYDRLYKKYQQLKAKQIVDAEGAFDEQTRRIEVFSTAAEDLVQNLRSTNSVISYQEDMNSRAREMEECYMKCQNDLVIERAKNLELRQELQDIELHGNKMLHDLLQNVTHLTVLGYGESDIIFSHQESGFEFKLEQSKRSEEEGGKNALLYNVVSPGTLLHIAPEWMQSEIVFDMTQVQVFFQRVLAVALCGGGA